MSKQVEDNRTDFAKGANAVGTKDENKDGNKMFELGKRAGAELAKRKKKGRYEDD